MMRILPFLLAAALCYLLALAFGVEATLAVAAGAYWPALVGWVQWLFSTALMYLFGALSWVEWRKNRTVTVKKPEFRGW